MMTAVHYGPSFKLVHDQTERRYRELLEVSVGRLGMVLLIQPFARDRYLHQAGIRHAYRDSQVACASVRWRSGHASLFRAHLRKQGCIHVQFETLIVCHAYLH